MKKEYSRAEIALTRRIEKVLSDILSDKYDCKVKIRYIPEEYGDGKIPPNHKLVSAYDPVRGNTVEFVPIEPEEGDKKHESDRKNANRKECSVGS